MSNEYFAISGSPATSSQGASATIRSEFTSIAAGFDKLPTLAGNGSKLVQINSGGTAMAAIALTVGALLFGGAAGVLGQDGTNLFWDNTAKRLGIGNAAPSVALDVTGSLKASLSIGSAIPGGTGARTWWIDNNGGAGNITRFRSLGQDAATLGTYGFEVAKSDNTGISQILGITASGAQVTGSLTASTSVVTPLVTTGSASDLGLGANGSPYWSIIGVAATAQLRPQQDNDRDLGDPTHRVRTGYFGTSVVTGLMGTSTDVRLDFQIGGASRWVIFPSGSNYDLYPSNADNTQSIGSAANRVKQLFTPIIDSGTTGALSLKTNNGTEQARIAHIGSAVNFFYMQGNSAGGSVTVGAEGSDTNVGLNVFSQGTGNINFLTAANVSTQFQVLHTASATSNATITGAAAAGTVGATIGVTGGRSLAITPAVVLASTLNFSTAAGKIIPGATSISLRNTADSADNLLISDAGVITTRATTFTLGASPTIAVVSGSLAITPSVVISGTLTAATFEPQFVSSETAIGAPSTNTTVAHGLGTVPRYFFVVIRNKTAELGFSIGDEVILSDNNSVGSYVQSTYADATNIGIIVSGTPAVVRKDTFTGTPITIANWKYVIRAFK